MSSEKLVLTETRGKVACLTLNRPEKANAYNSQLLQELKATLETLENDEQVNVLILTGAGNRNFCAGADLKELRQKDHRTPLSLPSARLFEYLANFPKVTLAAINGNALAGGLEMALSCDLRICAENATFGLPEPSLGLIPAAGGTQNLTSLVGIAKAKEIILGGKRWNAEKALTTGLVSEIHPSEELLTAAWNWAEKISTYDALALQLAKQAINLTQANSGGHRFEKAAQALLYELNNKKA